jgi:guanine deaminase
MKFGKIIKSAFALMLMLSCNIAGTLPVHAADPELIGVRAGILDFIDDPWNLPGHVDDAARFLPDGLLVISDGKVKECGPYSTVSSKYPGLKVTSYTNRIIMPGFVDGHIHVGQTRVLGAYGEQLLPWLLEWIFPEEIKFKNNDYAHEAINHYFDNLLANGTTTVQDFGTGYESATEVYFDDLRTFWNGPTLPSGTGHHSGILLRG